jgi:polyisoprenoid-binding protein YceI
MPVRYRIDPSRGRFTVQAFAAGLLSALGHSPTFAVGRYAGDLRFVDGEIRNLELELTVDAASLALSDRVSESDRAEIEGRMRRDVLDLAAYPEISYKASCLAERPVEPGRYRLRIDGPLAIRGVSRPHPVDLELLLFREEIRLRGGSGLRLSEHGIAPVTALAGAIRLKDELQVVFDLTAIEEEVP